MSQRIRLIGPDNAEFTDAMGKLSEIWDILDSQFPEDPIKGLKPPRTLDQDIFAAATRIFTIRADAPHGKDMTISPLVDPTGMLERVKGRDLFHLSENQVDCTKRVWDTVTRQVHAAP